MSEQLFPGMRLVCRFKANSWKGKKVKANKDGTTKVTVTENALIADLPINDKPTADNLKKLVGGECWLHETGDPKVAFVVTMPVKMTGIVINVFQTDKSEEPYLTFDNVSLKQLVVIGSVKKGCVLRLPLASELNKKTANKLAEIFNGLVYCEFLQQQQSLPLAEPAKKTAKEGGGKKKMEIAPPYKKKSAAG